MCLYVPRLGLKSIQKEKLNMHNIPVLRSAAVQSFGAAPAGCLVDPVASQEPGQLIALESQHPPATTKTHQVVILIAKTDFSIIYCIL